MRLFETAAKAEEEPGVTFGTPLRVTLADTMGENDIAGEESSECAEILAASKTKKIELLTKRFSAAPALNSSNRMQCNCTLRARSSFSALHPERNPDRTPDQESPS
jgi:hypothetical protein